MWVMVTILRYGFQHLGCPFVTVDHDPQLIVVINIVLLLELLYLVIYHDRA